MQSGGHGFVTIGPERIFFGKIFRASACRRNKNISDVVIPPHRAAGDALAAGNGNRLERARPPASGRPPDVVGDEAVRQRFGEVDAGDFFAVVEIGERAGDAQHAMIAARR